ncbi:uncharacterized protein LOC111024471 isoform X2 [Momordica charantia]|nr:uncharacterized protein LOC111024471 isoform X2 [Momordica charantia]
MKALLVQQKVAKALDDPSKLAGAKTAEEIVELQEIAFSSIILHLADNVLRKIHDAKTARETRWPTGQCYATSECFNAAEEREHISEVRSIDMIGTTSQRCREGGACIELCIYSIETLNAMTQIIIEPSSLFSFRVAVGIIVSAEF